MNTTQTTWSDSMILASVRDGHMMPPAAFQRCFDLAEQGLIDMTGTWRLTSKGEEVAK